jgi:phage tail sheath protein FI
MARPGTSVTLLETPGTISVPTDTGTWFAAGITERGPANTPTLIMSLNQFIQVFGARQSYSVLYDCIEEFFREGGNRCYVSRVIGPAPTTGTLNLNDSVPSTSLIVSGNGPGSYSSNYKVAVYTGTEGFGIQVTDLNGNILEDSGILPNQAAAVQWSQYSNYIRIALGTSTNNPVTVAATALSAGNSDRANITDTQWATAINAFTSNYGPGQVSAPGQTSATRYSQLVTLAATTGRVALLDLTDSATSGTLIGSLPAYTLNTRYAAAFAPWIIIPGITSQSTRTIPPSPMIAGMIARNDPSLGTDAASAGQQGLTRYAIGLSQPDWDDPTRLSLSNAGVNVVRNLHGIIQNYGWRSLADPVNDFNWIDFGNARLYMELSVELDTIGEDFVFDKIDGQQGKVVNDFHNALVGVLLARYNAGDLFGDTSDDAFSVDTGPSVNTLQTIANLELHAVVQVRMSPFAEFVQIQVVKRQTTDPIPNSVS